MLWLIGLVGVLISEKYDSCVVYCVVDGGGFVNLLRCSESAMRME